MSVIFPLSTFPSVRTDASESLKILTLLGGLSAAVSNALRIPINSVVHTDVSCITVGYFVSSTDIQVWDDDPPSYLSLAFLFWCCLFDLLVHVNN